ncbi:hypothetical protein ACFVWT_04385 [Arthrobacter sp. NPDC058288]|uniref:hypothetical protein n=1 Tax=Arthrobacter sp. NPDC058288 TaxID=3346424 RepID=UPI0036E8D4FD
MGLKEWAAKAPVATYGMLTLYKDRVRCLEAKQKGEYPLAGVTAVVESGEALSQRVTLTRFAAFGLISLAMKKKSGGESYLLIEGPEFAWTFEVKRGDQAKAQAFAAKVRSAAKESISTV